MRSGTTLCKGRVQRSVVGSYVPDALSWTRWVRSCSRRRRFACFCDMGRLPFFLHVSLSRSRGPGSIRGLCLHFPAPRLCGVPAPPTLCDRPVCSAQGTVARVSLGVIQIEDVQVSRLCRNGCAVIRGVDLWPLAPAVEAEDVAAEPEEKRPQAPRWFEVL